MNAGSFPGCPAGFTVATFRPTRSFASACRIARTSTLCVLAIILADRCTGSRCLQASFCLGLEFRRLLAPALGVRHAQHRRRS